MRRRQEGKRRGDGGADEASSHAVLPGRAQSLLSGGEEGGGGAGEGKENEGADLPLPFTQAPGKFLN